jgi:MFS transporter, ACS family, tartrate transporter
MFAGPAIGTNAPLTIAAFALASFGISGVLPVFWNLPAAFLGASAAAGGIAFINSVGNVSGYAAPQLVGVMHDLAGSYRMSMLAMGAMVILAGLLVPLATRLRPATAALAQQA